MTAAKFPLNPATSRQPLPVSLPTMYDLPSEDPEEPGLPDEFHRWQAQLCSLTFRPPSYAREQVFVASDLYLYYDPQHTRWYKRPDWFAVVGVSRLYQGEDMRLSYVVWQEQVSPIVAIEFLSPSTQTEDLGQRPQKGLQPTKWQVYEQVLAIPYYITFSRYTDELRLFQLQAGRYREQPLDNGRFWLSELEIGRGLWRGNYEGLTRQWLRWYDRNGNWIPTDVEAMRQERDRERSQKEAALDAKAAAEQRAAQLAERLQQLGIDPNTI